MGHLLLLGTGENTAEIAALLHSAGHAVTLARSLSELQRPEDAGFDLIVAKTDGSHDAAPAGEGVKSAPSPPGSVPRRRWQRHNRSGERILLDPESTLEVQEGVVALTVIHYDGAEVLLGLYGPGQILPGHPEDTCCIQLYAHSTAKVQVQSWAETAEKPGSAEQLRERLRHLEAWAAMQARPQIEQRLLGILSLLAEQFGRATPRGTMIDVRITHAQLASAVGATRATVTRRIGLLRRRGLLAVAGSGRSERYYLPSWGGSQRSSFPLPLPRRHQVHLGFGARSEHDDARSRQSFA
jgi:hypothetical protein